MPDVITVLIEEPDPQGPYGAKEVGQGPLLPVIPAVANAVYDAVGVSRGRIANHSGENSESVGRKKCRPRTALRASAEFPIVDWGEALLVPPPWEGGDGYAINEKSRRARERQEKEKANRP